MDTARRPYWLRVFDGGAARWSDPPHRRDVQVSYRTNAAAVAR
jgi:hypothetical protein